MKSKGFTHSLSFHCMRARKTRPYSTILAGMFALLLFLTTSLDILAQDSASCTASFSSSVTQNHAFFRAVDSQGTVMHLWNFGDGTVTGFSTSYATISHVYSDSGTYRVTHVIQDSLNPHCFDSTSQIISIIPPVACQVSFGYTIDSFNYHVYSFYSTPVSSSGMVDSILWSVNDTIVGTGTNLINHYFSDGTYNICVRIVTSTGCVASQCRQIQVSSGNACGFYASFNYTAGASNPQQVKFTPSPDSASFKYFWNFGDSTTSSVKSPSHLYASGGTYTVSLQITSRHKKDSCVSSTSQIVSVISKDTCKVGFTYSASPANPAEIHFKATNPQHLDSITWIINSIADSSIVAVLSGKDPVYVFQRPGCYSVYMSARTNKGCIGQISSVICLDSIPAAGKGFIASYPNPASTEVYFDCKLSDGGPVRITFFNSMGSSMQVSTVAGNKGTNHLGVAIGNLPAGLYYVSIQGRIEKYNSRIQKL